MSHKGSDGRYDRVPDGRLQAFFAESLKALSKVLFLLGTVYAVKASYAQEGWVFAREIPCSSAPVYGVPFSRCWASNVRTFRIGSVQSWRLTYADAKSESAVGLYSLLEAGGSAGLPAVAPDSSMIEWIRTAETLKSVTTGGTNWAMSAGARQPYVTFLKPQRQCVAFVRNGPAQRWILGAAFCRESTSPIPASEAAFISNAIAVRQ